MTVPHLRDHSPGRVRRLAHLGPFGLTRLALSWLLLGLTRAAIALLPFSTLRRLLGEGRTDAAPLPPATDREARQSSRIGHSVRQAAAHTPWRSDCYPQALTAHLHLRLARVPHTVSFGLRRAERGLTAHVWIAAADGIVTGGDPRDYTTVGAFTWLPGSQRRT